MGIYTVDRGLTSGKRRKKILSMRSIHMVILAGCSLLLAATPAAAQWPHPAHKAPDLPVPTSIRPSAKKSVEIGNFYLRRQDYRGALSRFKEAVKTDPDYAPAYLGLGKTYDKMGFRQDALANYQKYLDNLDSQQQANRARSVHRAMKRLKQEIAQEQAVAHASGWKPKPAPRVN
jgi:tetratricopeptide (TPR) repeat protein